MRRFFITQSEIAKDKPMIEGPDAHHITSVFRLKPGDEILLVDGTGFEYRATLIRTSKNQVEIAVAEKYAVRTESPTKISVGQGYLKDKKMDMLVRHLTEMGITRWIPMISEYSIPQIDQKKNTARVERWITIAREAVKQCGRTLVPEITAPVSFGDAIKNSGEVNLKIIFYENEARPLGQTLLPGAPQPSEILLLFGPEGGFSTKEVELATTNGFVTASLGPRILRAETASIAACALMQHIFGDMA